jgi:hypothetical protein
MESPHAPTGGAQNLKSVTPRDQHGDAVVASHSHTLRESIEGSEFKTS